MKRAKWWGWLVALLLPLAVLALYVGWSRWHSRRAWETWERQARAAGMKLTTKEVLASVVYPKGCEVLEQREVENLMVGLGWASSGTLGFVVSTNHAGQLGVLFLPFIHGPSAQSRFRTLWAECRECCRTNRSALQPLLDRLDAGRIQMVAGGKSLTWHWYLNVLRHLQTGLLLSLHDGRRREAMQWLHRMIRWQEVPAQRVHSQEQVLRTMMAQICFRTTWTVLESGTWEEDALAELAAIWEDQDYLAGLPRMVEAELAERLEFYPGGPRAVHRARGRPPAGFGPRSLRNWRRPWEPDLRHLPQIIGVAALELAAEGRYLLWRSAWSDIDKLWLARTMQRELEQLQDLARSSHPAPFSSPAITSTNTVPFSVRMRCALGLFLEPELGWRRYGVDVVLAQTQRNLVLTAIALKRFRLRHGEYPRTLDELAPELLRRLPWDFYAGKPLTYRRVTAEDFLLYSWGPVGKDEGGVLDGDVWLRSSDLIWPRALEPELSVPEEKPPEEPQESSGSQPTTRAGS